MTENGQFKVNLWWTKDLESGEYTVVRYDILDTFLKDKPIAVPYDLEIFHEGEQIFSKSNVSSDAKPSETTIIPSFTRNSIPSTNAESGI